METNNKLREALERARNTLLGVRDTTNNDDILDGVISCLEEYINPALAEPVKNYEVGTVGQQDERFTAFCNRHFHAVGLCDKACPCRYFNMVGGACSILWAQMPYEEGGAK